MNGGVPFIYTMISSILINSRRVLRVQIHLIPVYNNYFRVWVVFN